jgi:hypothetical protein
MEDWYCSERSLAAQEPLEGTAAGPVDHFIVLEHDAPFGPKGLEDSGLPPQVVERLQAFVTLHPNVRVQLVRRPEGAPGGHLAAYLAGGAAGEERMWRLSLPSIGAVMQLDLDAWLRAEPVQDAELLDHPLFLVCVHGRRDRCCARLGMPVYTAVAKAAPAHTYQTTHLGGHRFAATLIVLPQGICYGRVEEQEASALVSAHRHGRLHDLDRLRGRMRLEPWAQSAEVALRRRLPALSGVDDLRFVRSVPEDEHMRCVFRELSTGVEHTMRVRCDELPAIAPSCGAEPREGEAWVELRLH